MRKLGICGAAVWIGKIRRLNCGIHGYFFILAPNLPNTLSLSLKLS